MNSSVRVALENLVNEYLIGNEESRFCAGALLASTVMLIARAARSLSQSEELKRVGPDAARRIERARTLLEDVAKNPSMEEVAAAVGWSSDHLRRTFRAVYGVAPTMFQQAARLQHARLLLRDQHQNLANIAIACGFENVEYFSRWFKGESGLTPRQFRALSRQEF